MPCPLLSAARFGLLFFTRCCASSISLLFFRFSICFFVFYLASLPPTVQIEPVAVACLSARRLGESDPKQRWNAAEDRPLLNRTCNLPPRVFMADRLGPPGPKKKWSPRFDPASRSTNQPQSQTSSVPWQKPPGREPQNQTVKSDD